MVPPQYMPGHSDKGIAKVCIGDVVDTESEHNKGYIIVAIGSHVTGAAFCHKTEHKDYGGIYENINKPHPGIHTVGSPHDEFPTGEHDQ
jgi:hypothetical protein